MQAGIERIYAVAGDSLNFLNDAIRRDGTGRQSGGDIFDRLMMGAVYAQSDRLDDPPQETSGGDPDRMADLGGRRRLPVLDCV